MLVSPISEKPGTHVLQQGLVLFPAHHSRRAPAPIASASPHGHAGLGYETAFGLSPGLSELSAAASALAAAGAAEVSMGLTSAEAAAACAAASACGGVAALELLRAFLEVSAEASSSITSARTRRHWFRTIDLPSKALLTLAK